MKQQIVEYFKSLTSENQKELISNLMTELAIDRPTSVGEFKRKHLELSGITCPHCGGVSIIGHGQYQDIKRYRCKSCNKTFNNLTGTAVHKIHKKKLVEQYLFLMLEGSSLRTISKEMDICLKTAFDWRHKILNALNTHTNQKLNGIIEADETFFLFSEKGNKALFRKPRRRGGSASKLGINIDHVAVLTAYERKSGKSLNTVVCKGRITKKALQNGLGKWMDKKSAILCSDSHLTYQRYARENNIDHKCIFVRRKEYVVESIYHIQNVNYLHSYMKNWIRKFNGVSTKYLQNYMNYFNLVISLQKEMNQTKLAIGRVIESNCSYIQRDKIKLQNCIT
jgi:transposase-like protein